jgi:amino acid transporter
MKGQCLKKYKRFALMINFGGDTGGYAVGWFTLSLINAALAQTKGKSAVNWWIISLFLGPFCTLLIVLSDPSRPVQ